MAWPARILTNGRAATVVALVAVIGLAWGWLLSGAGMQMSALEMTSMAGMDGWLMQPAAWTPDYAGVMFTMWWVMMVAMMLPSAAPMLLLFDRVVRKDEAAGAPWMRTASFASGYLLAWGAFSAVATALQWGLESARLLSPMLVSTNRWLGAGILLTAGLWQLTPLKARCLRHCRSPLGYLSSHWIAGRFGALRMGWMHGSFCLGCCWFLMALLFFGGVMNLYWIVGIAIFVLAEKLFPYGHWFGKVSGVVLVGWGIGLAIQT